MKKTIKQARKHYILLNKKDNSVYICYHKQQLAEIMGLNVKTIQRHLAVSPWYDMKEYRVWSNIVITKRSKG